MYYASIQLLSPLVPADGSDAMVVVVVDGHNILWIGLAFEGPHQIYGLRSQGCLQLLRLFVPSAKMKGLRGSHSHKQYTKTPDISLSALGEEVAWMRRQDPTGP